MNVKQKGNAAEREVAGLLREYGFEGKRGLQYRNGQEEADVVGLPGYHIEVKRVERLNLHAAYEQSVRDAKFMEIPVVVHRRSREDWLITLPFRFFLERERQLHDMEERYDDHGERGTADER